MAHELNINNGKASFFSVKEKPWHGLGKILENCPNSAEAIKLAGLDFEVGKAEISCTVPNFGITNVPNKYATFRKDNGCVFGVVGERYEIVQNKDAFTFFDAIVGEGAAIYETAGCLYDGQVIFITAKLPDYIKVGNDDLIEQYLFLTASHDGSKAIQAAFTPQRIICSNTLNIGLRNCSNKVSIRHTSNASQKLKEAYKVMGISKKMAENLNTVFNAMSKVKITDEQLRQFITSVMAPPKKEIVTQMEFELSKKSLNVISDCYAYAMTSDTQQTETTRGTLWGAYNSITGYFQNMKQWKNEEDKLVSIMDGTAQNYGQIAFELALDMTN